MVGRERELEQLAGVISAAATGRGGLVLLAGEAGVGKTRLAEAATAGGGLATLRAVADQRSSSPYAPIAAVLREYLRREPGGLELDGPLAGTLGAIVPELGPAISAADRETLVEAVRGALAAIATRSATVILLDDLQWADAATLDLLPSLAEAAEEWPLLVIGAYRSEEIPRGHPLRRLRVDLRRAGRLTEITVARLDADETAVLAARVLGGEPGPMLRAALYDRTQGVPFFVEELAAALQAGGRLVPGPRGIELEEGSIVPIPETLRDMVRLRVEGLSSEGRRALEASAVVGVFVDLDLLTALGCDAGVGELVDLGVLRDAQPGTVAFRHDLVREALHADTPWQRRRSLHRDVGRLLEERGAEPALAAHHWLAAREPDRARPLLVRATRRSCDVHAYRDAAASARTALEAWPDGEDEPGRLDLLEELGRCAQLCGELSEAARAWEEVDAGLDGTSDRERVAGVQRRLATVYELQGASPKAAAARTRAAEAFEAADVLAEAAGDWIVAAGGLWRDDPVAAHGALDRAHAAARSVGRSDLESECLSLRGFMVGRSGRREEGFELMRSALGLALDNHHVEAAATAYWALGALANDWADYPAAQSALDDAVAHCRNNGLSEDEHFCLSCLAMVLRNRGEWTRAEGLARDLLQRTELEDGASSAHALLTLGLVAAARGFTSRARRHLRRSLAFARDLGLAGVEEESACGLALVDELRGVQPGGWRALVTMRVEQMVSGRPRTLRLAATFGARRGDTELVYACADASASWAPRFGSADCLAALAHALGEVAMVERDHATAAEQFAQAFDRLGEIDAPFERALTQARLGTALTAAGDRAMGVERMTGAYRTFRKLDARPFAHRTAADLEASGESLDERLGRRAARDLENGGLTRRELEILRLVAVGRTNREIASLLFLSPRTVDMHVRSILAKLGCRTRTEATGRAHELALLESAAP
nr:AAA family ATPase [Microbacterium immunditiarum]